MYEANRPVPLGEMEIEFVIDGRSVRARARAVEYLLPHPILALEVSDVPREPWSVEPAAERPNVKILSAPVMSEGPSGITLENGIQLDVLPFSWAATQRDATLYLAQSPSVVLQTGSRLESLQFNILNFSRDLPFGTVALNADPWAITIYSVPSLNKLKETLRADGGYAVTHNGVIKLRGDDTFSVEEVMDLLYGLDDFLSFVCGSYCSLTNVVGIESEDNEAWKRWGSHHVSSWGHHRSWFDITVGGALLEIFPVFWQEYKKNTKTLSRVLKLYAHSNETFSIDVSCILSQTALEMLSYLTVGSQTNQEKPGQWIERALNQAGIPFVISPQCKDLEGFRQQNRLTHGPHALVEIRNSIIHRNAGHGDIPFDVYREGSQLGLWYIELMLLQRFGYTGKYANRLEPVGFAGRTEPVPWVSGQGVNP